MKHAILLAAGLLLCGASQACTCFDEPTFAEVTRHMSVLVEGRVTRAPDDRAVDFYVVRSFKGGAPQNIRIHEPMMCYASINASEMQAGQHYVIALEPMNAPANYSHGVCAESTMLREGDDLFTFVRSEAGGYKPEKKFYGKYSDFVRQQRIKPPAQTKR